MVGDHWLVARYFPDIAAWINDQACANQRRNVMKARAFVASAARRPMPGAQVDVAAEFRSILCRLDC